MRIQQWIEDWHDRQIPAGDNWDDVIKQQLDEADIVLLLISSNFISSKYCMEVETKRALELNKVDKITIIPIFAKSCVIEDVLFTQLQGTPKDCNWIVQKDRRKDRAYTEVVETISKAVKLLG